MKSVSLAKILSWKSRKKTKITVKKITELFNKKERVTALDILNSDLLTEQKFWLILRKSFFSEKDLRSITYEFAKRIINSSEIHRYEIEMVIESVEAYIAYPSISNYKKIIAARVVVKAAAEKLNCCFPYTVTDRVTLAAYRSAMASANSSARSAAWNTYCVISNSPLGENEETEQIRIAKKHLKK